MRTRPYGRILELPFIIGRQYGELGGHRCFERGRREDDCQRVEPHPRRFQFAVQLHVRVRMLIILVHDDGDTGLVHARLS